MKKILIIVATLVLLGCGKKGDYIEPKYVEPTQTLVGEFGAAQVTEITTESGVKCVVAAGFRESGVAISCNWK